MFMWKKIYLRGNVFLCKVAIYFFLIQLIILLVAKKYYANFVHRMKSFLFFVKIVQNKI